MKLKLGTKGYYINPYWILLLFAIGSIFLSKNSKEYFILLGVVFVACIALSAGAILENKINRGGENETDIRTNADNEAELRRRKIADFERGRNK